MIRPEGSVERLPHNNFTFKCPIHDLLRDKVVTRTGPRRFRATSAEPIRIEVYGRVEVVLTEGTEFYSVTWDWEQPLHNCRVDYFTKG